MDELLSPKELSELPGNEWIDGRWYYKPYELMRAQLAHTKKLKEDCPEFQSMYKEGITPLLKDASEVTAILPSQATAKKLEEVCPDCKGTKKKRIILPDKAHSPHTIDCPTCQGTGKKLRPDRDRIAKIIFCNNHPDKAAERDWGLLTGSQRRFYLHIADQIISLMEGK